MNGKAPAVSVVMPLYNGAAFLDETVKSVLAQTLTDFELLIVDDGSTDGSHEKARDWAARHPERISVLTHPGNANRGCTVSRNLGVQKARADLIALIDADDTWPRDKLAHQIDLFDRHPELGLVGGAALYWDSWRSGDDWLVIAGHRADAVIPPGEAARLTYPLGTAQAPCPSTLMVRRNLVDRIGGFEERFNGPYQLYEDQAFLIKCYIESPVYMTSRIFCNYRQHETSCVSTVMGDGRYHEVRHFFLDWLSNYLDRRGIADPALRKKLERARMAYGNPIQRLAAKVLAPR